MNRFIAILIAVLAATYYVESSSLIEQLDESVQTKTTREGHVEAILTGLRFINPLVEDPKKISKRSLLGFLNVKSLKQSPADLSRYLNWIKDYIEAGEKYDVACYTVTIKRFFEITTNLYGSVKKNGRLHSAITKYVDLIYGVCTQDFRRILDLGSNAKNLDNFIKVASNKNPEICNDIPKDTNLREFKCATNLEKLKTEKISELVLDVIKEQNDMKKLSEDTDTKDLKSDVRKRVGRYINFSVAGQCQGWLKREIYGFDGEVMYTENVINCWTQFAKIAGVELDDEIVKAKGRKSVCDQVNRYKIFDQVTEIAYGKIEAPKE